MVARKMTVVIMWVLAAFPAWVFAYSVVSLVKLIREQGPDAGKFIAVVSIITSAILFCAMVYAIVNFT